MKTLIDVLAARSDFVKVASEWAESASKAEVETFTQIYPQKEELAKYDFAMPDKLTDTEIEAILETADQLVAWASDVKEYALQQSLQGKAWKNWKLVEGRARRTYCSETAAAEAVQAAGFDPYEHKVLGITAMTRMLGKKKFEELLGDLLVKPQGKPTLVPLSDNDLRGILHR